MELATYSILPFYFCTSILNKCFHVDVKTRRLDSLTDNVFSMENSTHNEMGVHFLNPCFGFIFSLILYI